jgi:hypothetical protein
MNDDDKTEFLKKIGYKKRRLLEGDERKRMLTFLLLLDPIQKNRLQTAFIENYYHAGKEYEVTYGFSDTEPTPYIEEITTHYDL